MKSVEFTVQRLIGTASESNPRLQYRSKSPTDGEYDHVTSDDVTVDEESPTGARDDDRDRDDSPSRPRHEGGRMEPLLIPPSIYLDYARQFLWQLTGTYRPGQLIDHFISRLGHLLAQILSSFLPTYHFSYLNMLSVISVILYSFYDTK